MKKIFTLLILLVFPFVTHCHLVQLPPKTNMGESDLDATITKNSLIPELSTKIREKTYFLGDYEAISGINLDLMERILLGRP